MPLLGLVPLFTWSGKTRKLAATEADYMPYLPHGYLLTGAPPAIVHGVTKAHKRSLKGRNATSALLQQLVTPRDLLRHKWTRKVISWLHFSAHLRPAFRLVTAALGGLAGVEIGLAPPCS